MGGRFHRLIRRRDVRVAFHVLVLLGLLASLGIAALSRPYFTRGVETGLDATPIPHTDVNPLGVNTLLNEEADPAKVERSLDMIAAGGFTFVRQMFAWYEIEPARGVYVDPKTGRSTWEKYDRIVDLAVARGLEVIARLDKPPRWAREGQPNLDRFPDGPPNDDADYANFVRTVVERYRGKVRYIQIWNEPNLTGEWGGLPIDPARFTQLLKAAYIAAKEANPEVVVLMPGLAPTDQRGPVNLNEFLFLQGMYDAGAKDYFDIATAMVYGYGYSPYDRRVEFERNNFSRVIQTREVMVRNGDADKPIWAAEYGWVSLPNDWTGDASVWGDPVSAETQARYLLEGYVRAQREWPWLGALCIWNFRWPTSPTATPDAGRNPTRGFSIVNFDFSPTPAYTLLARSRALLDRAYTGAYAADSRLIQHDGGWTLTGTGAARTLVPGAAGATLRVPFSGPRLDLHLAGSGQGLIVTIDGRPAPGLERDATGAAVARPDADGRVTVADGLEDGPHLAEIRALAGGDASVALAGFVVVRRPWMVWAYPWIYGTFATMAVLTLLSLVWNWRERPAAPLPPAKVGPAVRRLTPDQLRARGRAARGPAHRR
ncbi:MAG: cellulase family glycosylhydrolase [Sphaerobacter sp.]|nr:cellulase family glycosylhydrolase [Sphaerobacter sp.]